jgi:hypothetical protein
VHRAAGVAAIALAVVPGGHAPGDGVAAVGTEAGVSSKHESSLREAHNVRQRRGASATPEPSGEPRFEWARVTVYDRWLFG